LSMDSDVDLRESAWLTKSHSMFPHRILILVSIGSFPRFKVFVHRSPFGSLFFGVIRTLEPEVLGVAAELSVYIYMVPGHLVLNFETATR
jgi:hypothetical protein